MRKIIPLASVGAASALLAACSGGGISSSTSASGGQAATGGTLSLAIQQAPTSFTPGDLLTGGPVPQLYEPVYDTLLKRDKDANVSGNLASEYSYDDTQTTLTLKIRSGVTASDGSTIDAAAVKANLDKAMKGTGESGTKLASVTSVEVKGTDTVVLHLKAPNPSLLRDLGGSAGMIASPKALAAATLATTPVGSGPYVLDASQTTAGNKYTYTRNDKWWGDKSQYPFDKIVITVFNDNAAQLNALRAGQINGASIGAKDVNAAKGSGLTVLTYSQYTSSGLYLFDREGKLTPALKDKRVRQAINYAIDRKSFVEKTQGATGTATDQMFNTESEAYDKSLEDLYPYDVAKAKALMAEAGYADGFTVTMPDSSPIYPQEQAFLTEALKAINITPKYEPVNGQSFISNILGGKYSMTLFQTNTGPAWDVVTQSLLPGSLWNTFHVTDPTLVQLIDTAQKSTGEAQTTAYRQINKRVLDEAWFAIINQPAQFYAMKGVTATSQKFANFPPLSSYRKS